MKHNRREKQNATEIAWFEYLTEMGDVLDTLSAVKFVVRNP
jgi:hypothetical protein